MSSQRLSDGHHTACRGPTPICAEVGDSQEIVDREADIWKNDAASTCALPGQADGAFRVPRPSPPGSTLG
jgi:hypothetical protein